MKNHWNAFRTIHYFLTGRQSVADALSDSFIWYLKIEDRAYMTRRTTP